MLELVQRLVVKKGRSLTKPELELYTYLLDRELALSGRATLFTPWFRTPIGVSSSVFDMTLNELCQENLLNCTGRDIAWIIRPYLLDSYSTSLDRQIIDIINKVVEEHGGKTYDELRSFVLSLPEVKNSTIYQVTLKHYTY